MNGLLDWMLLAGLLISCTAGLWMMARSARAFRHMPVAGSRAEMARLSEGLEPDLRAPLLLGAPGVLLIVAHAALVHLATLEWYDLLLFGGVGLGLAGEAYLLATSPATRSETRPPHSGVGRANILLSLWLPAAGLLLAWGLVRILERMGS